KQRDLPFIDGGVGPKEAVQQIAGRKSSSNSENWGPCQPVTPHGEGSDYLGIAYPSCRSVDRGSAGLAGKKTRNFSVNKGLQEAKGDRQHPNNPRRIADCRCNTSD